MQEITIIISILINIIALKALRFYGVPFGDSISYVVGSIQEREEGVALKNLIETYGVYNSLLSHLRRNNFYSFILPNLQLILCYAVIYCVSNTIYQIYTGCICIFLLTLTREGVHLICPGARFFGNIVSWMSCFLIINEANHFFILIAIAVSFYAGKFWRQNALVLISIFLFQQEPDNRLIIGIIIIILGYMFGMYSHLKHLIKFLVAEALVQKNQKNNLFRFKLRDFLRLMIWAPALFAIQSGIESSINSIASNFYVLITALIFFPPFKIIGVAERYIISFLPFAIYSNFGIFLVLSLIVLIISEARYIFPVWKGWNELDSNLRIQLDEAVQSRIDDLHIIERIRLADYIKFLYPSLNVLCVPLSKYVSMIGEKKIHPNKRIVIDEYSDSGCLIIKGNDPKSLKME